MKAILDFSTIFTKFAVLARWWCNRNLPNDAIVKGVFMNMNRICQRAHTFWYVLYAHTLFGATRIKGVGGAVLCFVFFFFY